MQTILTFDFAILDWIRAHLSCPFMDAAMPFVSLFAEAGIFFILCTLVMFFFPKWRRTALSSAFALAIGLLICNIILKPLVGRVRPYDVRGVSIIVDPLGDGSFPSGHALAAFEFAAVMLKRRPKLGVPAVVLAVLISFSRLYLYLHFPTDVLTGIVLGIAFGIIGCVIADAICRAVEKKKGITIPE